MKIYKYRSNKDKHLEKLLESNKFWFAKWNEQNDPMEGFFQYFRTETPNWIVDNFVTEKKKLNISCFSSDPDNMLMWSHYANCHKGVCFEIDTELETNDQIKILPVKYGKRIPYLSKPTKKHDPLKVLSKKLTCWSKENEMRAFSTGSPASLSLGKVTKIIFGLRCENETKELVKSLSPSIPTAETKFCFKRSKLLVVHC